MSVFNGIYIYKFALFFIYADMLKITAVMNVLEYVYVGMVAD
jgi:hypothetical protein